MKRLHALAAAVFIACASSGAAAQTRDDSLYQALGQQSGLDALMGEFLTRLLADGRTEPFFRDIDVPRWRKNLAAYFCVAAGGPCTYEGKAMGPAHEAQDVTRSDFNALVEVLQDAMDARRIPFAAQGRLLAVLAPTHRDIVNKH